MPAGTPSPSDLAPAAAEAWLERHSRRVLGFLLGAAVFVRLIYCLQLAAGPLPRIHAFVVDSDNHFFDEWGRRIAAGDWLQPSPLHPMASWMRTVAEDAMSKDPLLPVKLKLAADPGYDRREMEARLWDHWLGGATFFQEPAYPYLVGFTYRLAGPDVWRVFAWQLALGVAGVLIVHRLSRRLFSETAAAAAGALAVLAPIPLVYEATLLRDGLVVFATLALALAMHWAAEGGGRRWLVLGLAFGAAALVKQSFLFFPAVLGVWRLAAVRAPLPERLAAAGLVLGGMCLALLPAALRNVAVGVPALALNGSAAAMLAVYQTASASPLDIVIGPEYTGLLVATDGRMFPSLLEAARTHANAWGILALDLEKLLYAWHGFESRNNVDFYLFRQGAPLLASLPATFVVLAPLAAIGMATRHLARAWPLLVAIVASLLSLALSTVLSRYRAPLTAALLPLAGAGAARLACWVGARRWLWIGAAGASAALYLAWATSSPPGKGHAEIAPSYAQIGLSALERGEPSLAALYFQESLRLAPANARVEARLGQSLLLAGDPGAALLHVETARRSFDSPRLRELHARVLAALGRREEAISEARAALDADPATAGARELIELLERRSKAGPEARSPLEAKP
jgi:4-amino-4-deoxy-L-arabinose transferase-like glycosyltransferase